ncbi:hypothetical protein KH5_19700 [Urechidicola sp. KH5]
MKNNDLMIVILSYIRKVISLIYSNNKEYRIKNRKVDYYDQDASDQIKKLLEGDKPCMIARFGSIELDTIHFYKKTQNNILSRYLNYMLSDVNELTWSDNLKFRMQNNTGFFPATNESLNRFSELVIEDIKNLDILGSWLSKEKTFKKELKSVKSIRLGDMVPFIRNHPWSSALENKNVLIIHPFDESIEKQFLNRKAIFKNKETLPDFNLITYKPIQSFAGNYKNLEFNSWFEALEKMKDDIMKIDFDIAILGCGSYGFTLASFIKDLGKKSVHLGGATQLLFGIIGKRWENEYDMKYLINDNWIRPNINERPQNFQSIENGCYW